MLKCVQAQGKGDSEHKPPITPEDLEKLYSHPTALNPDDPQGLCRKIWFELTLHFCRRGRENLQGLTAEHFEVKVEAGKRFVQQVLSERTKNHQGDRIESGRASGGRMYATETRMCPVQSFEKYIAKRNQACPKLFQRAQRDPETDAECWYENKPLGKNTLGQMMATLSGEAGLSRRYTNHSVRATSITLLSEAGFEARHIKTVSGHRNEASIASYCTDTSMKQKEAMSAVLSAHTSQDAISCQPHASASATCTTASVSMGAQDSNSVAAFNLPATTASSTSVTLDAVPSGTVGSTSAVAVWHPPSTSGTLDTMPVSAPPVALEANFSLVDENCDFLDDDDLLNMVTELTSSTSYSTVNTNSAPIFNFQNCSVVIKNNPQI